MVTQLVIGIGNFTDKETYGSLISNINDVANLLIEQGMPWLELFLITICR